MSFFIQDAFAASPAASGQDPGMGSMLLPILLLGVFIFFVWMQNSKRIKQHRDLVTNLAVGDEVVTSGGILGKITKLQDDFIILSISENVQITIQKGAVSATVPKGTLKTVT